MEYEKIKQLMNDMGESKLSSIEIDFPDGTKISMKKEEKELNTIIKSEENVIEKTELNTENMICPQKNSEDKNEGKIVKSPMVGTFYLKPSPTSTPYVEIGKVVKKGDTLCIIEAMKLMNEIECEYDGKITEIFIKDGEPVEYGSKLFAIS